MKKFVVCLFLLIALAGTNLAQVGTRGPRWYGPRTSDPAKCTSPAWYWNTVSLGYKYCSATDTWSDWGGGGAALYGTPTTNRMTYFTASDTIGSTNFQYSTDATFAGSLRTDAILVSGACGGVSTGNQYVYSSYSSCASNSSNAVAYAFNPSNTAQRASFQLSGGTSPTMTFYSGGTSTAGTINFFADTWLGYSTQTGQNEFRIGFTSNNSTGRFQVGDYSTTPTNYLDLVQSTNTFTMAATTINATGKFHITNTQTPASASDTCTTGQVTWDSSYVYVCTATNTWKRAAITTW